MESTKLPAAIGKALYDNPSIINLKIISFNPIVLIWELANPASG